MVNADSGDVLVEPNINVRQQLFKAATYFICKDRIIHIHLRNVTAKQKRFLKLKKKKKEM